MAVHISVQDAMSGQGTLILAVNPWTNGELLDIATRMGRRVRPLIIKRPPPWDKMRSGTSALSSAQRQAIEAFKKIAEDTKGLPAKERYKKISEALAGKSFGGTKTRPRKRIYAYQVL